jgi:hypothetical protein
VEEEEEELEEDDDPRAECINDPTVRRHYWRYRMHVRLEDLCSSSGGAGGGGGGGGGAAAAVVGSELPALLAELLLLGGRVTPAELAEARAGAVVAAKKPRV